MTNTKKLSDYTVSDIEKILKEDLSDNEMLWLWNFIYRYTPCKRYIYPMDEFMLCMKWRHDADEIQENLGEDFKFKDNYVRFHYQKGKYISFSKLDDEQSQIDYKQCAMYTLKDKELLKKLLMNTYGYIND